MPEGNTTDPIPVASEMRRIPGDTEIGPERRAPAVPEHAVDILFFAWVFVGSLLMPRSEHLIPLQY